MRCKTIFEKEFIKSWPQITPVFYNGNSLAGVQKFVFIVHCTQYPSSHKMRALSKFLKSAQPTDKTGCQPKAWFPRAMTESREPQSWTKINGKPRPPLPPKSRMEKWRVFALRAPSSLPWRGWGLLFHFILSKIAGAFGTQPFKHGSVFLSLFSSKHCITKTIMGFGSCDIRNNQGRGLPDLDFSAYYNNLIQYLFTFMQ